MLPTFCPAQTSTVQIVNVGNTAYEQFGSPRPLAACNDLMVADERLLSQKSAFWLSPEGWPQIALVGAPYLPDTTTRLSNAWYRGRVPLFITPSRRTTSICHDFLSDERSKRMLLEALDERKEVLLSPYVMTGQVRKVASYLMKQGFDVRCTGSFDPTVSVLSSKTRAHSEVFTPLEGAVVRRPRCVSVSGLDDVGATVAAHERPVSGKWVLKADRSIGGVGVFVLPDSSIRDRMVVAEMLTAKGYNDAFIEPPFILEEFIEHVLSPTADAFVSPTGQVHHAGLALQRLFDDRYYTGFYATEALSGAAWFSQVSETVDAVGQQLSALGYHGFYNLDFVVDQDDCAFVVEINLRRSALQDGFGIGLAWSASGYPVDSLSVTDYVECRAFTDLTGVHEFLADSSSDDVTLVATTDAAFESSYRWVSLISLGSGNTEGRLASAVARLADLPEDATALSEDIGTLPIVWPDRSRPPD